MFRPKSLETVKKIEIYFHVNKCQFSVFIISFIERSHLSESLVNPEQFQSFIFLSEKNQDNPEKYLTVLFLESFIFSSDLFITEVLACIVKAIQELLRQMRNEKLCCILYIYIHTCVCVCVCVRACILIYWKLPWWLRQ